MDSYVDIVVRPEVDLVPAHLLSAAFEELHRTIVSRGSSSTGISFPAAGKSLGDVLRIHDDEKVLRQLSEIPWLRRNRDYFRVEGPREVPAEHDWRRVSRVQPRMTAAKARRLLARGSLDVQTAAQVAATAKKLNKPFVEIRSGSTGQRFRLFIDQARCEPPSEPPEFNAYGLGGAVPWF